ncbi:hypothetical protein EDC04DRAFT_2564610 [Pisolithus marmoratus]|nr:hypothetical protein EDC04DRAFT_2564610 [Pisolithus marmoratus]
MPTYHNKLDHLLSDTGRFHELSSWQKKFKSQWQQASMTSITLPLSPKYHPDTHKWVCTCPQFIKSRFLVCKHLVQAMHPVSPTFFLEVARRGSIGEREMSKGEEDEEPDGNMVDTAAVVKMDQQTFKDGLEYQIQFGDHQMLNTVEREGTLFIWLMENCLDHERRENSSHMRSPTTWDKTMANMMFYHSCPAVTEHGT